jgi:membrane protein implicated in regulation of membrane protease activity
MSTQGQLTMRPNPFIRFNRAAEAAGYPALLVVTVVCLAIVLAGVTLLALMQVTWAFVMAMLSLVIAVGILWAAMMASLSDPGEPAARHGVDGSSSHERATVVPLPEREAASAPGPPGRKAG